LGLEEEEEARTFVAPIIFFPFHISSLYLPAGRRRRLFFKFFSKKKK
jgi:hypothetical protein